MVSFLYCFVSCIASCRIRFMGDFWMLCLGDVWVTGNES